MDKPQLLDLEVLYQASLPQLQADGICTDEGSDFFCTHKDGYGHAGKHVAHGVDGRVIEEWD